MTDQYRAEGERIREAYARRTRTYGPTEPWVYMSRQERERALIRWARLAAPDELSRLRVLEIGCGTGSNIQEFIRLGCRPENLVGNDLLQQRLDVARRVLPPGVTLLSGDAATLALDAESFDVVFQSMVCSSILDDAHLRSVAHVMWSLVRPGGGMLWYDFTFNNPANPDVRGIPLARLRGLFPGAIARCWRLTLAPPLSRAVTRLHPSAYTLLNAIPFLRTHVLCWIPKTRSGA